MTAPSAAPATTPAQAKPRRRWRRWSLRLVVAALVARLLLALLLAPLADFAAGFAGLGVSWRSASLSLLGLSLHVEDLVVRVRGADDLPPLLTAQELVVDLSMRQLLGGEIAVVDAGLAGVRVTVHRIADGTLRLPPAWLAPADATPPPPSPAPDAGPWTFESPVRVASARIHDLRVALVDASGAPPQQHTATVDLDVADAGFPDRSGTLQLRIAAPQFCDELRLEARGQTSRDAAELHWQVVLRGLRPAEHELPAALRNALGEAHIVDLDAGGELRAAAAAGSPYPELAADCRLQVMLDGVPRTTLTVAAGPTGSEAAPGPPPAGSGQGVLRAPFELTLHTDGVVDALRLAEGRLLLAPDRTTFAARLAADGITCRRIAPLLAELGVTLPTSGVDVSADVDGEIGAAASADLSRLVVRSGGVELLALPRVAVRDLRQDGDTLAIDSVEIVGPELTVEQAADGAMVIAGMRTAPPAAAAASAPAPSPATTATPALPKLRLGRFDWSGARLTWTDATRTPPASMTIDDVRVQADGITLGHAAPPGRIVASLRMPGVAERLTAQLRLASLADGLDADFEVDAAGITAAALVPWLEPLGITPELQAGTFTLAGSTRLRTDARGVAAELRVGNARFVDGDTTWFKLRGVEGTGVRIDDDGASLGAWTVSEPYVLVQRDGDRSSHAFGMRFAAAAAGAAAPPAVSAPAGSARGGVREPAPGPAAPGPSSPQRHGELAVRDALLVLGERGTTAAPWSVGLDLRLGADDGSGQPLPFALALKVPSAIDALRLDGTLAKGPERTVVDAGLTGTGLRGEALGRLLPPGVTCTLQDGGLAGQLHADLAARAPFAIAARLSGFRLDDRGEELLAIDDAALLAPQCTAADLHVADLHMRGVRARLTRTATALHVPGFALATPPAPQPEPAATAREPVAAPPAAAAGAPLVLPRVRLDALALGVERIVFHDRSRGEAVPLVAHLDIELTDPWRGDPTAAEPAALVCSIRGGAEPLGATLTAKLTAVPFAMAPAADLEFLLGGIDTTQIAAIAPSLADAVAGEAKALEIGATAHAVLDLRRRDPAQIDFGRPFAGELVVDDVRIRDAATDRTFATVEELDVIARAIDPKNGTVLLKLVEVDAPALQLQRDADGLHVLGVRLRPPATGDPTAAAERGPDTPAADAAPPERSKPAAGPTPEFAVDRLRLFGLALDYRDATTSPPTHLSVVDTDAELQHFSTRALTEPLPLSFDLTVRGGDVELEERILRSSVLSGLVGSAAEAAAGAVTGSADQHETELRPMLDQFTVSGQVTPYPRPKGRVQVGLDGLELTALRGLAATTGVDIADGVFDLRLLAELRGYDGLRADSESVFTFLSLTEPPGGPISTYLRLPAPLDTVLFLLRNSDGEQRLPIRVDAPGSGMTPGEVRDVAVEALTRLIANAVASAPTRALTTVTGAVVGTDAGVPDVVASIPFAAGDPLPESLDLDAIAAALERDPTLGIVLTHELGAADVAHARRLANPPRAAVEAAVARLQAERTALATTRAPIAGEVVALYAAAERPEADRRHADLQALDTRIGEVDGTLNETLRLLGGTSERDARRRTRSAARELAEARIDAVAAELRNRLPELDPARIERRAGRGLPVDGAPDGGRVAALLRRRAAQRKLDPSPPSGRLQQTGVQWPSDRDWNFPAIDR